MTVQAWFTSNDIEVTPGTATVMVLTVANLGNSTESYALAPTGMGAGWTTVRPAYITLFGGSEQQVDVELHPPRLPSTTAGALSLGVRVVPQSDPDEIETAEATVHVAPTYDRTINVLQPALRARRRGVFELLIDNGGNTQASCRLHLIDPTHRVEGDFDPPAVGVEPGGSSLVRLKMKARRRQWERRSRSIPFRVEADQLGAPTAIGQATFVQAPVLPERLWSRLLGLAVVAGALVGGWFGWLRPEIRRVADDAVAKHPVVVTVPSPASTVPGATIVVGPTAPPNQSTTTSSLPSPSNTVANGDPIAISLPVSPAVGETKTQTYTVPGDKVLRVTDYLVQNTFGDSGTVQLLVGSVPFAWNLDNLAGVDARNSWVTPIELAPGSVVKLDVTCSRVGRQGSATCSPNVLLNGRLLPAPAGSATTTSSTLAAG